MGFWIFKSKSKKSAKELIAAAYNVYNYRRDIVAPADAKELKRLIEKVEELYDDNKTMDAEYKSASVELEKLMRKTGGTIYPLTFWADNTDVVIVAGILALSVRSFFFQPFQIPTNSMYPTFYGMTPHVYLQNQEPPSLKEKLVRLVTKKASNYNLVAPESGEVFVQINQPGQMGSNGGIFHSNVRPSRWLGILPSQEKIYNFLVNGKDLELSVPADFSLDSVMQRAYPFGAQDERAYLQALASKGKVIEKGSKLFLSLGEKQKGERILNFDILGGDMLFVDRFTYNFRKPRVGEPFVFRTGLCDGLTALNNGVPDDKYYIKRLVGEGGDTLKIEGSALIRNGKSSTGSKAFKNNAEQYGDYSGYKAEGALKNGRTVQVPLHSYYAMGDNSANSLDSRYWGEVPEKSVVGRALVIFYPFTERWGAAK